MNCDNATKSNRKSGVAQWRDLRCAPRTSQMLKQSPHTPGNEKSLISLPVLVETLIVRRQIRQNNALKFKHIRGSQLLIQHFTVR
jgi:hypothetical protein